MAETVNINRKELFNRIEELQRFINTDKNRYLLTKDLFPDKIIINTKRNKDYQLIAKTISKEYNNVISQTTVWRILKIKEYNIDEYKALKNNNASIKGVYENLFKHPKMTTPKKEESIEFKNSEEINFSSIQATLQAILDNLETGTLPEEINRNKLREIDDNLFHLRKRIGKITSMLIMEEIE